jgi:hypothetical protein
MTDLDPHAAAVLEGPPFTDEAAQAFALGRARAEEQRLRPGAIE